MTTSKIKAALDAKAVKKTEKIEKSYGVDVEAYKKQVFDGAMGRCGNRWEKDDKKRIYFNDWNMFYDYENGALEAIDDRNSMNYDAFERTIIEIING